MRAMVLHNIGPIESAPLRQREVPGAKPSRGEALVKVACCALCRTDLHIVEGDLPMVRLPIIPGHQVVGTVVALGEGVTSLRIGQRVGVAWLQHTCGRCRFCAAGRENLCESSRYTGYHADGGLAQYATVPADFAYEIPDGFSDVDAAPLLCAGIVGYRALVRSGLKPGGRLAIYGFGSSAHLVIQIAIHRNCVVHVVTRRPEHQRSALSLGAAWAGDDPAQMPDKADAAILFAPSGALVPPALEHLERGGALALAGIHMSAVPSIEYDRHLFQERDIHPVTANTRADAREFLREAARIPLRPQTRVYSLADANRALADMKEGKIDGTGVVRIGDDG
jgi:propanol-preferring alcohol dehydrogenase